MADILDRIEAYKRREIADAKERVPLPELRRRAAAAPAPRRAARRAAARAAESDREQREQRDRDDDQAHARAVRDFDIRAGSRGARVRNLSGGNQQKLLVAKVMQTDPRIVIVDEPTRGIDIGTKQQMYVLIHKLAAEGRAIVVISSEMQEVIGLADRILVMRHGRITGELGADASEDAIVRLAMGVATEREPA